MCSYSFVRNTQMANVLTGGRVISCGSLGRGVLEGRKYVLIFKLTSNKAKELPAQMRAGKLPRV